MVLHKNSAFLHSFMKFKMIKTFDCFELAFFFFSFLEQVIFLVVFVDYLGNTLFCTH